MKLLLFGGVGFIGTNTALLALERGHKVVAYDNLARSHVGENLLYLKKHKGFTLIQSDIRDTRSFKKIPKHIDCIINFAANASVPVSIQQPRYDFEVNAVGHLNVLDYARNNGNIPVIFASSNKAYTDKINTYKLKEGKTRYTLVSKRFLHGFDEDTDLSGHDGFTNSPYGVSKITAEKYSREYWHHYGVPIVINRMSCVYGTFQKGVAEQGWVDWFLRAKRAALPLTIYGNGKQVRDVLYGEDVAELYLEEAEHIDRFNGGTFNVGGGETRGFHISLLELITLIDTLFPGPKLKYAFADWRGSDHRVYISDIRKMMKVAKWRPHTNLTDGLKMMWKSYGN